MAPATAFSLPSSQNITRVVLPNGITVLVFQMPHLQSVALAGSLNAGAVFEPNDRNGLASMTAAALMRGTQTQDFAAIHSALEDVGADLGYGTGFSTVAYGGKSLAEDLPLLLAQLSDTLRHPVFPDEQVENLRGQRVTELRYAEQDIRTRAERAFRRTLYPSEHVYHRSPYGSLAGLADLTADDLRAFHAQHYGPQGMNVAIVGAVTPERAIDLVSQHLGDWTNPSQPGLPDVQPVTPPAEPRRVHVSIAGKEQTAIVMGTIGPSTTAPDFQATRIANSILGEFGMMGRIGQIVREEMGLAYYAYSQLEGGRGPGAWSIAAGVAPDDVHTAIDAALNEVHRIVNEPVDREDLEDNLAYFTGRLPLRLESASGIASQLIIIERFNLGLDYIANYRDMLYRITLEDVQAAARKYLDPHRFVIATAGPDNGETS